MAKKGFIAKIIEGPERSETYARSTLPTNRWELGWDVFKTNKGKLFGLNLLTLLFCLPLVALFVMRYVLKTVDIAIFPFTQNMGVGYPAYPATSGLQAQLALNVNVEFFKFVIIGVAFLAVAISGGFYVMRNMVWAEGVMVVSDFFKGVKQNYFVVFFSLLFYTVIMAASVLSLNMSSVLIATGGGIKWLLVVAQVLTYVIMAIATMMVFYMITLGITYKLSFGALIRNSFILSIALVPTNVFFIAFSAVWLLLLLLGKIMPLFLIIGIFMVFIWGVSLFMLVWTDYSNWVFDTYVNDKVPGAKKNRGIYKPSANDTAEDENAVIERSKLTSRPIKPITDTEVEIYELPTSFSRADLQKLEETKEAMRRDSDKYAEEHKNDVAPTIDELMGDDETEDKKSDDEKE
ncbi:MAG: hypothetical protein SO003_07505 [Candidatus Borkfalkiaceae bacterium]|nr:hypothetical protein [Christensenellaceae bacterium]